MARPRECSFAPNSGGIPAASTRKRPQHSPTTPLPHLYAVNTTADRRFLLTNPAGYFLRYNGMTVTDYMCRFCVGKTPFRGPILAVVRKHLSDLPTKHQLTSSATMLWRAPTGPEVRSSTTARHVVCFPSRAEWMSSTVASKTSTATGLAAVSEF